MAGCSKSDKQSPLTQGSIYGTVTDLVSNEPIANANVSLRPGGETTLTGSDGLYEFLNVADGNYSITVTKAEYVDQVDDYVIKVSNGRRSCRDIFMRKRNSELCITDINGANLTALDFGSEEYVTVKAFNIFNNSLENIRCSMTYACNWLKSISSCPASISPGQTVTISVEIDRSKLTPGKNETILLITTTDRSNIVRITAQGKGDTSVPVVQTLPVTDQYGKVTSLCNTFHAKVTYAGNPSYHHRGFCFSDTKTNPTIDENRIDVSGKGVGEYSYTYAFFPILTKRYYVRAWVMYGPDNQIQYGNTQSFVYNVN